MADQRDDALLQSTDLGPDIIASRSSASPAGDKGDVQVAEANLLAVKSAVAASSPLPDPTCGTDGQDTAAKGKNGGFGFWRMFTHVSHWISSSSHWFSSAKALTSHEGDSKRQAEELTTPPKSEIDTSSVAEPKEEPLPAKVTAATETAAKQFPDFGKRYEVKAELGKGGFGRVFLVFDRTLNREVAVKVAKVAAAGKADLLQEAQQAASIQHRNIVTIHDVLDLPDGSVAISMEFIPGSTLRQILNERGKLSVSESVEMMAQIAGGIQAAHDKLLIHRDMKPENTLVGPDKTPKVLDFGLSVCAEQLSDENFSHGGTAPYMSPEQVRREIEKIQGKSDIWALGVMLYEMLTGRRPFQGKDRKATHELIKNGRIPPRRLVRGIPKSLERICMRCLVKDPEHRMPDAATLAKELRRFQRAVAFRRTSGFAGMAVLAILLVLSVGTYVVNPEFFFPPQLLGANIPRTDVEGRENLLIHEPTRICFPLAEYDNAALFPVWDSETGKVTFSNDGRSVLLVKDAPPHVRHIHMEGRVEDWNSSIGIYFHLRQVKDKRFPDPIDTGFVVSVGRRNSSDRLCLRINEVVICPTPGFRRGRMEFHRYFLQTELTPPLEKTISLDVDFVDDLLLVNLNGKPIVDRVEALKQKELYEARYPELWQPPATIGIFGHGSEITVTNFSVR